MKEEKNINRGFILQVLATLQPAEASIVPEEPRLDVHAAVSKFAFLYERIRTAVDYKDEHVLRKSAILRILKRQLLFEHDPEEIAANLLRELIGARYLPNNELPESKIPETAVHIRAYQSIVRARVGSPAHFAWLRRVLSVELEELLVNATREKAFVTILYEQLVSRVRVTGTSIDDADLQLQIYIACHRSLLKADDDTLSFKLLRIFLPEWMRPREWIDAPVAVAERLIGVEQRIKAQLRHPLGSKLQRAVKPWAVSFSLLTETLLEKPDEATRLLETPEELRAVAARLADRQYRNAKGKLRRGAFRAIVYIFLTKMLVAFALEVPIERAVYGEVSLRTLAINLLFPPCLMFLVALFIRVPGRENTQRLQQNIEVLRTGRIPNCDIRVTPRRGLVGTFLLGLLYATLYLFSFGLIAAVLLKLHFSWISILVFLFFLCTVSFFAFRLRVTAREQVIVHDRERLRSVLIDVLSLPILRVGLWLSRGISRLNVFIFFFDFLLEAPFKIFLTVLEEWLAYLKEKKEDLQ